jgi:hypothetical protein
MHNSSFFNDSRASGYPINQSEDAGMRRKEPYPALVGSRRTEGTLTCQKLEIEEGRRVVTSTGVEVTGETSRSSRPESNTEREKQKKEEFPGTMQCMPAGNSFPQICVVSEYIVWKSSKSNKSTKGQWILVT